MVVVLHLLLPLHLLPLIRSHRERKWYRLENLGQLLELALEALVVRPLQPALVFQLIQLREVLEKAFFRLFFLKNLHHSQSVLQQKLRAVDQVVDRLQCLLAPLQLLHLADVLEKLELQIFDVKLL